MDLRLHHLALRRPLAVLDLETTGVDTTRDRVVEVAAVKLTPGGPTAVFHERVHPGGPIPAAATAVHGLADADVAAAPPFAAVAPALDGFLAGCDLAGFGLACFDLPVLAAEFGRAGIPFRVAGRRVLDALAVYHRHEPRDLAHAVKLYLGRDHAAAHSALADALAAAAVLDRQVAHYGLPADADALHAALVEVDVARKFRRDGRNAVVFAFGKHAGRPLAEVAAADPGYLRWMLTQPFLDDTLDRVRAALAAADRPR